jgi:putative ABC transport system permease protein
VGSRLSYAAGEPCPASRPKAKGFRVLRSVLTAELRRRRGRTALTALGLAVGVGLVVIVNALSAGLDDAQEDVLAPLTGVGTDMRVSRPLSVPGAGSRDGTGGFASLPAKERRLLLKENPEQGLDFKPGELGEPGEAFTENRTVPSELSFPVSEAARISTLDGAEDAAAALSLQAVTLKREVPPRDVPVNIHGGEYDIVLLSVTGVDAENPSWAPVTPGQVIEGEYFSRSAQKARAEAIVDIGYARTNRIAVEDTSQVLGKRFEVVGLSAEPLGGTASNAYLELGRLQQLSDRKGRANVMQVRAESTASVDSLSRAIGERRAGAQVTTAAELADRVGGPLVDPRTSPRSSGRRWRSWPSRRPS